jgi:hypothetical protein
VTSASNFTPPPRHSGEAARPPALLPTLEEAKPWVEWLKLLAKASGVIGALIALLYFLRIGYVPLDSLGSALALGVVVALISLGAFVALVVCWSLPAWIWIGLRDEKQSGWLQCFVRNGALAGGSPVALRRVRLWLFLFCTIGGSWLWMLFAPVARDWLGDDSSWPVWLRAAGWGFLLAGVGWYAWQVPGRAADAGPLKPRGLRTWSARLLVAALYSTITSMPLVVLLGLITLSDYAHAGWSVGVALLTAGFLFTLLLNGFALTLTLTGRGSTSVLAGIQLLVFAGALLYGAVMLGSVGRLHDRVLALASVRIERAHIVLDKEGCEPLTQIGVQWARLQGNDSAGVESCLLPDVTVETRLGAYWRIDCREPAWAPGEPRRRSAFVVPANHVMAWYEVSDATVAPRSESRRTCGDWPGLSKAPEADGPVSGRTP